MKLHINESTNTVEPAFGYLTYEDSRFQQLFNELKKSGYSPRETYFQDRFMSICAITINSDTKELPQYVEDCINNLDNVTLWDVTTRKGTNCYKIKFSLRDSDFVK